MPNLRIRAVAIVAALPDLGLAGLFLVTWVAPQVVGAHRIGDLLLLMLLEFIVVHSAGFMGSVAVGAQTRRKKVFGVLGLGAFYTLFVGGFALAFHTWWPLVAFWGLTGNRLLGVIVGQGPTGREQQFLIRSWVIGAVAYLAAVFFTTLTPIPELGVTAAVRSAADLSGGGLWIDQPYRVLAAGFLYFGLLGLSELWDHRWFPAHTIPV